MNESIVKYVNSGDIQSDFERILSEISPTIRNEKIGFKIHFGEGINNTHIKPVWLKKIPEYVDDPYFIECNVLYRGNRTRRPDHLRMAKEHGFDFLPIDILDGEQGEDELEVEVSTPNTEKARLGGGIKKYNHMVALTHFKGHMAEGFGGSIKNIGMGLGSRAGKLDMHSLVSPYVIEEKCVACGICVSNCPVNAIEILEKAMIDSDKCIGCTQCIAVCPKSAVEIPWNLSMTINKKLMEKTADYALAATKGKKWWFVNFLTDITYDCDCLPIQQKPIIKDIGILVSNDPVAVDQASLDLVIKECDGRDPFLEKHNVDGTHILDYAETIGLGTRSYKIEEY